MKVFDFINDGEWYSTVKMTDLFEWATSPEIEASGEGRRQLGYHDGYTGEPASTSNGDYMRGYHQGVAMRTVNNAAIEKT
jgi:hypothetical protein